MLLMTVAGYGEQTGNGQRRQLPLNGTAASVRQGNHLGREEASIRLAKQHRQNALPTFGEQRVRHAWNWLRQNRF